MRKLLLCIVCLAAMMAAGTSLKAQEISITLVPGWNWISYTNAVPMEVGEALGDFTPVQGDIIKSKNNGTTTYTGTMWRGSLTHFMPGQGYKYFSARTETTGFVFAQAFSSTVTTTEPAGITPYSATSGGSITTNAYVFAKGICWATHSNPTPMDDDHSENGGGNESFTEEITELIPNTPYYVRAYVVTQNGIVYGDEVSFTTIPIWTIEATPNPIDGGTITGTGSYEQNVICNLTATPNEGFVFANWSENGEVVSTEACYTFTVNADRMLVANFTLQSFTIDVSANPSYGGSVSGGGSYNYGQSCTVFALASAGYIFSNWTENGNVVSTNANYTFIANANRILTANFVVQNYTINVSASPNGVGSVSGGGNYSYGQSCTVSAIANTGYTFSNWTENGNVVSTNANYTFTVSANRNLVANFTVQSNLIRVFASPIEGGDVSGWGHYNYGQSCTVSATANMGYTFSNWTENGNVVSTDVAYTFIVNADRTLVANFTLQNYTITVSASPSNEGSVSGGGSYNYGQYCTVHATANNGYSFINWTENDSVVSTNANYTFTVNANRTLAANFIQTPTGVINSLFSVSATQRVYFSQGNLQYQASTNTWRFADNQYDYIGDANSNISSSYNGWIDLFGWGTSGYNHGANCYQPWSTSTNESDYFAYGIYTYNLNDQTGQADWGYNPISNGGNTANQWRTLTASEWSYVINSRPGIRFAMANVNNVKGLILLPDNWNTSTYVLYSTNDLYASFSSNTISAVQWTSLENAGAVFLPAAGNRLGTTVYSGSAGYYWSSTYYSQYYKHARCIHFYNKFIYASDYNNRCEGQSVRLVHNVQ